MKSIIICDERTIEDYRLGVDSESSRWDSRPYYLLNKVVNDPKFDLEFRMFDDPKLLEVLDQNRKLKPLVFVHLDTTFVPDYIENILSRYTDLKIFNHQMKDNSKRKVEDVCEELFGESLRLTSGSHYEGMVVVKPNRNAGDPEGKKGYSFIPFSEVDPKIFDDPELVVERMIRTSFIQEAPYHHNKRFIIFGNELFICELYSMENKVKQKTSIWQFYRPLECLYPDFGPVQGMCLNELGVYYRAISQQDRLQIDHIKRLVKRLKLDFGSIDVIESHGVGYVIDVNKTPWERGFPNKFLEIIRKSLRGDVND